MAFFTGAQRIELWAYGFGDDADKSALGGITVEVNIDTNQTVITQTIFQNRDVENKPETLEASCSLWALRSIMPKPSAQKLYHIFINLSRFVASNKQVF